jgi:cobalt-zinc-cadmium resistance protein CzcA
MLNRIIELSLQNRLLVCALALICVVLGAISLSRLPIDAFPDTTPVQVQVNAEAPALSPEEVEQQVTVPLELQVSGLPGLVNVRSISKFGFSQIVATFSDKTDLYLARQLVAERIQGVELPNGLKQPRLGPISTGLGEVFHYSLRSQSKEHSLSDLRELHDWVIKPALMQVPGVAEINSWGGFEKQYHVVIEPEKLIQHHLTFEDVFEAMRANNRNVGGGQLRRSGESLLVQGIGLVQSIEEISNITISASDGIPVRIGDVATVEIGHEIRRGAVSASGEGEVVLGLGFMLMGENSAEITRALQKKLAEVKSSLPDSISIDLLYDRTELIDKVITTVEHNLIIGALLVIAVLFIFLGNFRAGLIVAAAIPLAMLFASNLMLQVGIAASLLSFGALDFGLIVDSSVIMAENCVRHAHIYRDKPWDELIRDAAIEVRKPTMFGELIILIVFIPILALEGIEGKLFRPMALTMIFALLGSLLLSLTLTPVLCSLFLKRGATEHEPKVITWFRDRYLPLLDKSLLNQRKVLAAGFSIVVFGAVLASQLGSAFLPRLSEGALAINAVRLAGISIEETLAVNKQIETALLERFPDEIEKVWSRIGSAEIATDPMGVELTDFFVTLKSRDNWSKAKTQQALVERMERDVFAKFPGMAVSFSQPIEMRMNEMIAGVRSDIGIKIYGDNLETLTELSDKVQTVLLTIPGAAEVRGEQLSGQAVLQMHTNDEVISRLGIPRDRVLDAIELIGRKNIGEIREGQRRFPLVARLSEQQTTPLSSLRDILLPLTSGNILPFSEAVQIKEIEGPATINHEWSRRRSTVQVNVRDRDIGSFVSEAQKRIAKEVALPEGYLIEWGGQFENMVRAQNRLMIVVPLALGLILFLLYLSLGSLTDVLVVATGIPFGVVGGVFALWLRDMPFTVSAAIGIVALSGVAILNGLVLVTFIQHRKDSSHSLHDAVREACSVRLRPILMTSLVAAVGFIPMAVNTGVGGEVQRPLATVVIGGLLSNTPLTLIMLPVLYITAERIRGSLSKPVLGN